MRCAFKQSYLELSNIQTIFFSKTLHTELLQSSTESYCYYDLFIRKKTKNNNNYLSENKTIVRKTIPWKQKNKKLHRSPDCGVSFFDVTYHLLSFSNSRMGLIKQKEPNYRQPQTILEK